jgi:hypothetical protein
MQIPLLSKILYLEDTRFQSMLHEVCSAFFQGSCEILFGCPLRLFRYFYIVYDI